MLYTRKGDGGTTKTFACDQRVSKSSAVAEALGTLDELNSFLGTCKVRSGFWKLDITSDFTSIGELVHWVQENLFIVQAQVAGADKTMDQSKVAVMEDIVDKIEKVLPPIKTFFIAGGDELSATFDFARTLARRAERRVVGAVDEGIAKVAPETLAFLNRLSSLLYALARLCNHKSGIKESSPSYS
ncbi:MAG: cob(I)yrinic acid a,c-diamide adenosyltransferase [bacterium]|nr:cob(I)yrinic acid a,c-diamide adenosyltransferase [bacterium]